MAAQVIYCSRTPGRRVVRMGPVYMLFAQLSAMVVPTQMRLLF